MIGQGYAPSLILFTKMKRLLFSLLAMLITSVCLAQDDNNNKRDVVTKETVTQFSNDEELLDIWRKQHEKEPKVKEPKVPKIVTPEMMYKKGKSSLSLRTLTTRNRQTNSK